MEGRTEKTIAQKDAEALYIGNLNTVEFDLDLPCRGPNGSDITWESANTRFLRSDGKVTQPKYGIGGRNVALTATFHCPEGEVQKTYTVHILEEKNKIKISRVFPIRLKQQRNTRFYLPTVAIVETEDKQVLAHPVEWDGGTERVFGSCGKFRAEGKIAGTEVPVRAEIEVEEHLPDDRKDENPCAEAFSSREVSLDEGGMFWDAQQRNLQFLLGVNDDQMLYNFRSAAGLDTKGAPEMIGWDAPDSLLRGHTTGHYLSALALCYEATGNDGIRKKAEYMVRSLRECQETFTRTPGFHPGFLSGYSEKQFDLLEQYVRYPEIWAPYYTLHKILAGLLDCRRAFQSETAKTAAAELGDWVCARLSRLSHDKLATMWGLYIAGEFGGMNDVMAQLFLLTGEKRYLAAARMFDNDKLFYPMEQRVDTLNGMHANQHIPQIIGAMRIFEATGEARYYRIASYFWDIVTKDHIYAIGGTGEGEMFHEPGRIAGLLSEHTAESCASYNMLKLTKELFRYEPDAKYMDYYERTMVNHILASGEKKPTGASTYFMPLAPGFRKEFDDENSCCHGTGLENHFKYAECIYFREGGSLAVNLFLNSHVCWKERGVSLTQRVAERGGRMEVSLTVAGSSRFALRVRRPYWCKAVPGVCVNGTPAAVTPDGAFWTLDREWSDGDCVEFSLACSLRLEHAPDDSGKVVVCQGPYVLAALTDSADFLTLKGNSAEEILVPEQNGPGCHTKDGGIVFVPLCMVEDQKYQVYLRNESLT